MPTNLLAAGLAHLTAQLASHASESVRYCRGQASAVVRATFGKKLLRLESGDGSLRTQWTDMDFLIPAVDLVIGGESILPERGDQILVQLASGAVDVYQVMPYGTSDPEWRWADPHQSMLRVHTLHVEQEDRD